MPRNIKAGTSHRKTRGCPVKDCDKRPRGGRAWKRHMSVDHGIVDVSAWYRALYSERYGLRLDK